MIFIKSFILQVCVSLSVIPLIPDVQRNKELIIKNIVLRGEIKRSINLIKYLNMRKIDKITLKKADIDQSDILKKKQMKNLWGGNHICQWFCTTDANGTWGNGGLCSDYNDCWDQAEDACPFPAYGIIIFC